MVTADCPSLSLPTEVSEQPVSPYSETVFGHVAPQEQQVRADCGDGGCCLPSLCIPPAAAKWGAATGETLLPSSAWLSITAGMGSQAQPHGQWARQVEEV